MHLHCAASQTLVLAQPVLDPLVALLEADRRTGQDGGVPAWECPRCRRRFGRVNQTHECAPALSEAEYFATGPAHERPIFEAVRAFVETLGPVHVEFVSVGIFLKRARTFAELRPMERWVALSFSLRRTVRHPLIVRKVLPYHGRYFHVANLRRPDDFDDALQDWLAEAYLDAEPES